MERTSRGGGRVWTNLNESHEMRKNGEKFSWDLKVLKIPRGDKIPQDFSPINANAATISEKPVKYSSNTLEIQLKQT